MIAATAVTAETAASTTECVSVERRELSPIDDAGAAIVIGARKCRPRAT